MLYLSPRPDAAPTTTSGNGQRRSQVDQSHRIVLTLTHRHADVDITQSDEEVREERSPSRRYGRFSGDLMLAADRNRMVDLRAGQGLGALPRWSFQRLP